jgi:hypothetical protein
MGGIYAHNAIGRVSGLHPTHARRLVASGIRVGSKALCCGLGWGVQRARLRGAADPENKDYQAVKKKGEETITNLKATATADALAAAAFLKRMSKIDANFGEVCFEGSCHNGQLLVGK